MNRIALAVWMVLAGGWVAAQQMTPAMMGHTAANVASGGGVVVGDAVSGGTASRLLFSDGSTQVSTASPALGAALQLSSTLDVQGNISNSSGATCFTGLTGAACFTDNIGVNTGGASSIYLRSGTTSDQAGMIMYNSLNSAIGSVRIYDSAATATVASKVVIAGREIANPVVIGNFGLSANPGAGQNVLEVRDGSSMDNLLATVDGVGALYTASGADIRGAISNGGSAFCNEALSGVPCFAEAIGIQGNGALAGSYLSLSPGTGMRTRWPYQNHMHVEMVDSDTGVMDVRSASGDIEMRLNGAVSARFLTAGMHLPTSTTIPAGDCDADAEVGRMRRYAKDASNITLCGCQKVGGVFSWAAMITGGDCT